MTRLIPGFGHLPKIEKMPNGVEMSSDQVAFVNDLDMSRRITEFGERFVSFFGGSGIDKGSYYYEKAVELAQTISLSGCALLTGGGSGIMEAGNRGANLSSSGSSYGILTNTIQHEFSSANPFIDTDKKFTFNTLSVRLLTLISNSRAVVFFPGGFGTFEELFSLLVREKVEMMKPLPIYLFGSAFWNGLVAWLKDVVVKEGVIGAEHLELFRVEDDSTKIADEIIGYCS
ncbi:MAG: TIGR00730 family Rossman fold protein [Holosporales bacterium]|jgi:uncharacterized protein (TIGR00730 family)|nr:TIGR00730 family Rossman fold protein [Holosporales bacterium]